MESGDEFQQPFDKTREAKGDGEVFEKSEFWI